MEIHKCKTKLKLLFNKFVEENFELSRYYSENLIKCLDDGDDKYAGKFLDTPFFSDLLMNSIKNLNKMSDSVKIFIFEVFVIAIKNELQFCKIADLQGPEMLTEAVYEMISHTQPTALYTAGFKAVNIQISHYTGLMRLVQLKIWKRMLRPDNHTRPIKVQQAVHNFLSKFVWKLNEFDENEALIEVLENIVNPIRTSEYLSIELIDIANEFFLYEPIIPYLKTLVAIVRDCEDNTRQNKVLQLLYRHFIIEAPFHVILHKTRNYELVCLLCEFHFYFVLALCKEYLCSGVNGNRDIPTEIINEYYNIILCLLNKRMTSAVIFYAVKCIIIWTKIDTSPFPVTFERHGRTFNLQNQFITMVLTPLVTHTFIVSCTTSNRKLLKELEVLNVKLVKMNSEHIFKAAYSFKQLMENSDSKKIAIQCLREIFKLKGFLNVAQAGMLYQSLYYILKLHVISDGSGALILNENPLKTPDDVKLLSLVLEAIRMLLKEHDINWYENVEIISLQTTLMDLLKQNFMPSKQLLQALDLTDLSIKRFLSPDMALLMESKRGSTLNEIGAIMQSYIQHDEWEVRDSAMHMLLTCTEVAFIQYLPLRNLLLENNLIVLAAHAALSDTEFYVQAIALRCLAAATKIESIWKEVLIAHSSLYVQLIYILQHNTEGIVRKEAANVLTEIYVHQKISKDFIKCLYSVMVSAALKDLHWEVQIAALNFWKIAIQNLMSNTGMIDGKFPSVTFSKEKRKIITLNDNEIIKQLIRIMNDLSSIGCLKVLHKCLNEESNISVMEQAYCIAKELVTVLDYYKFEGIPEENISPNSSPTEIYNNSNEILEQDIEIEYHEEALDLSLSHSTDQTNSREMIIETIVNTTDYDLIVACYEKLQIKSEAMDEDIVTSPMTNPIEPNIFLRIFKETDYLSIIEGKTKWITGPTSLDSLLDEILAMSEVRTSE